MALKRSRPSAAAGPALHVGIDRYGSMIQSQDPITNQATSFLRWLIHEVTTKLLSPADVVQIIGAQDQALHQLFSVTTMAEWAMHDRFWLWPLAKSSRASEEGIRNFGQQRPLWLADEYRWTKLCDLAEKVHGHPSRYRVARVRGDDVPVARDLSELL